MTAPATQDTPSSPDSSFSAADRFMLRLLRLPADPEAQAGAAAQARAAFQTSIVLSGIRCLITYIFLPFIAPLIGVAASVGEPVGIVVALVAIVSIVASTRRFWAAGHSKRWHYTILGAVMMCFLLFLLATDISNL